MVENTEWTKELEKERLLKDSSVLPEISDDVALSPLTVAASDIKTEKKYPSLLDFGNLSMEGVDGKLKAFLHKICINFQNGKLSAELFEAGYEFRADFFYSDFEKISSECGEKLSIGKMNFDDFFIAHPQPFERGYTVKVRFHNEKHAIDVKFWISKSETGYKIFDLTLLRFT